MAGDHPFESTFSGQSLPEIQNRDKDPAIPELGYLPKPIKIIDAAAFICASAYILYSIGSYGVELAADAVASSLIGVDAVERSIHDMAIVEGSLTKETPRPPFEGWAEANAMCGRYYRTANARTLADAFEAEPTGDEAAYAAAYNITPRSTQLAIRQTRDTAFREIVPMRWGLIAKKTSGPDPNLKTHNARSENLRHSDSVPDYLLFGLT